MTLQNLETAAASGETITGYLALESRTRDANGNKRAYSVGRTYTRNLFPGRNWFILSAQNHPLDPLNLYPPHKSRYAIAEIVGEVEYRAGYEITGGVTPGCVLSNSLRVTRELSLPEIQTHAVNYVLNRLDMTINNVTAGVITANDAAHAPVWVGDVRRSIAAAGGLYSHARTSGVFSAAVSTGNYSVAEAHGGFSIAACAGSHSVAHTTGFGSIAACTDDRAIAASDKSRSVSVTTGNGAIAIARGIDSACLTAAEWSVAICTGGQLAACTGPESRADAQGVGAIAAALNGGRAKAGPGGAIVLCYKDPQNGEVVHIRASKVGENGIKPDTWYSLSAEGEFVEIADGSI